MKKRGAITLVFDDGYQHIFQNIIPLLDQYKIPSVIAVPINEIAVSKSEKIPTLNWKHWLPLRRKGHEIAAHSVHHIDLTRLSSKQLESELVDPHSLLNADTLIYPGGAFNKEVIKQARKHYIAARSTKFGLESLPPNNPFQLKTHNFTRRNFRVWKANLIATIAWVTNRWYIETYHIVDDTPHPNPHQVTLTDFKRHLSFISKLPIRKVTISQTMDQYGKE